MPKLKALVCAALWATLPLWAAPRLLEPAPEGQVESGVPLFSVLGPTALGLTTPPSDLALLPDGRVAAFSSQEIAFGDGVRWETFRRRDERGIQSSDTRQFVVAPDGGIYVGVTGGFARVVLHEDGTWSARRLASLPPPWEAENTAPTFVREVGRDWIWWWGSGPVFAWRPGEPARVVGELNAIESAFEWQGGLALSDRSTGVSYRSKGDKLEVLDLGIEGYVEKAVTRSLKLSAERTLLCTVERGAVVHEHGRVHPFSSSLLTRGGRRINDAALIDERFVALAIDGVGLAFFDREGRLLQVLDRSLDHRLSAARRILGTGRGVVWALVDEGVVRVGFPDPVSHFGPLVTTSMRHPQPYRFQGRLWLMADGKAQQGIYSPEGRLLRFEVRPVPGYVTTMLQLEDAWIASSSTGLYRWHEERGWETVSEATHSAHFHPRPVTPGRWLFIGEGEWGWLEKAGDQFKVTRFATDRWGHVYDAFPDEPGHLWGELGTGRAIRVKPAWPEPVMETFSKADGLKESWVQLSFIGSVVRANTDGSLLRFDPESRRFNADTGFASSLPILQGASGRPNEDARGRIWVTRSSGVYRVDPGVSPVQVLSVPTAGLMPVYFIPEKSGVVWFSEANRLGRFDPSFNAPLAPTPKVLITRIDFGGGRSAAATPDLPPLAHDENSLTVHFVSPHAPVGRAITFESKLEGGDGVWKPENSSGAVNLSHLGPGHYRLSLRARLGEQVSPIASLGFTILPPWYQTSWARATGAVLLLGLILGALRFFAFLDKREKRRLERLVAERTQELNTANEELARKMTEVIAQNEQRRALEQQMYQIQRVESMGTLAGGIAHDLNNMLTGMIGFCDLAAFSAVPGSEQAGQLAEIRQHGLRAKDLISRLLIYSRRGDSRLEPLDLAVPVNDALRLIRATLPVHLRLDQALAPVPVLADSTQIHQIVLNLVTNAIQACGERPGAIRVQLTTVDASPPTPGNPAEPRRHACLEVTDTGSGMSPETLAHIFEPFFTTKEPGAGTGLGLSTVQGIVTNHGGVITVDSKLGEGSTFRVYLPLHEVPLSRAPFPTALPFDSVTHLEAAVWVVDDEKAVARSTSGLLERCGYRVRTFTDPREAIRASEEFAPRIAALVTDLSMPGITGLELASRLLERYPDLPVLVISGYLRAHLGTGPLPGKRTAVLAKPFTFEELRRSMERLIGTARPKG